VTSAKETLEDSITESNSPLVITGNWYVETFHSSSLLLRLEEFKAGNPFTEFRFLDTSWEDIDFGIKLSHIDLKIRQLREATEEAKELLKDAIPINSDQVHVVYGTQRVEGSFSTLSLKVDILETRAINYEENLSEFLATFVLYQKSIGIESSVRFTGELHIGNLFTEKLNGILVRDIARLNKANHFQLNLSFKEITVNGDLRADRINGIKFSEEIIFASNISGRRLKPFQSIPRVKVPAYLILNHDY